MARIDLGAREMKRLNASPEAHAVRNAQHRIDRIAQREARREQELLMARLEGDEDRERHAQARKLRNDQIRLQADAETAKAKKEFLEVIADVIQLHTQVGRAAAVAAARTATLVKDDAGVIIALETP